MRTVRGKEKERARNHSRRLSGAISNGKREVRAQHHFVHSRDNRGASTTSMGVLRCTRTFTDTLLSLMLRLLHLHQALTAGMEI